MQSDAGPTESASPLCCETSGCSSSSCADVLGPQVSARQDEVNKWIFLGPRGRGCGRL